MSAAEKKSRCANIAPILVFYACDEVSENERKLIDEHLAACASCAEQLAGERALWEAMNAANPPEGELKSADTLLSQCRSQLAETLDDLSVTPVREHWQPFGGVRRWMALRPAWSGAMLIFFGVLLGAEVLPWLQSGLPGNSNGRAVNVLASQKLTDDQLSKMAVAGINLAPWPNAAPGTVQLQLRAEQPMVLSGNVDDSNMRRVLTYVVENGERFDAGVRLDCLDALKAQARDAQVRKALLLAARKDQNPAVRMKALEALKGSAADDAVREAMLDALAHDANPGVRVEVVNMLVHSLEHESQSSNVVSYPKIAGAPENLDDQSDDVEMNSSSESIAMTSNASVEKVIRTLEELQKRDPSRYVRLRSAAALRQIGPREPQ
ncbi:MAG TPA: HEAT repeat domain-containing protein [Methylomirabilota bacterium]|jgi:anti-sigma factor RsiW|nr:HEAT repeat domain-containing protein [Methylomirabilota bacterium]